MLVATWKKMNWRACGLVMSYELRLMLLGVNFRFYARFVQQGYGNCFGFSRGSSGLLPRLVNWPGTWNDNV